MERLRPGCLLMAIFATVVTGISNTPNAAPQVAPGSRTHSYSFPGADVHFTIGKGPGFLGVKEPSFGTASNSYGVYGPNPGIGVGAVSNAAPTVNTVPNEGGIPQPSVTPPVGAELSVPPLLSNDIGGIKVMSENCRYYCRTPEGDIYCCEDDMDPISRPLVKGGRCPPSNTPCEKPLFIIPCSNDARCPDQDKCCFDPCFRRHTCSNPSIL